MTDKNVRFVLSADDKTAAAFARTRANLEALQARAGAAAGLFGTLGVAVGAAFTGASLAGALETLDTLAKLSQKSGIAVESLSALRFAGEQAGVGVEDLGKGFKALATNMASAAGGNKDTAAVFGAIGVAIKDARGNLRGTDEVLRDVADRFASYADGAGKSALATELFGKAGQALIPLLNQGSAGLEAQARLASELGAVYGGDLAKKAEEFNDNLKKIGLAAEGAKVVLLEGLLPTLNAVAGAFIENAKNSNLFVAALKTLGQGAANRLGLTDTLGDVAKAEQRRVVMDGLIADLRRYEEGAKSATPALAKLNATNAAAARAEIDRLNAEQQRFGRIVDAQLQPGESDSETTRKFGRPKRQAPVTNKQATAADDEFRSLLDRISKRIAASREELDLGRQLTEAERFQLDVEGQLTGAKTKLGAAQRERIRTELAEARAVDEALRLQNDQIKAADQISQMMLRSLNDLQRTAEARAKDNETLRDQLQEIGLTARAVEDLRQKRVAQALAEEELNLIGLKNADASAAEITATERVVDALRTKLDLQGKALAANREQEDDPLKGATAGLKNFAEESRKTGLAVKQATEQMMGTLSDELTNAFMGKGFDAKRIVDQIIAEFLRLQVVKPLLNSIFGEGGALGGAGFFTSLLGFGGARAMGGPVSPSSAYLVGEHGPEMFVPRTAGTVVPRSSLMPSGGVTINDNRTVNVGDIATASQVARALQASDSRQRAELQRMYSRGQGVFR
jgi:hypothetical protein